ncbi:Atu4866 domain-containing protein [Xanthomonas sp. 3793]|uniref:Atu4866 domain-containing protein n=1 Tax=Xanthomonas sp. 3793 TaxID=3035312 RepID=UPI0021681B90|nr:Atu4866 domain-containing protein [Xanthomonas sp. 3793]
MSIAVAMALGAGAAGACNAAAMAATAPPATPTRTSLPEPTPMQTHPYVGMWVTGDGRIRQTLLANGRYDEARDARRSAYQGRYDVTGSTIPYWDDSGFTADGQFVTQDELHHGGMILHRQRQD